MPHRGDGSSGCKTLATEGKFGGTSQGPSGSCSVIWGGPFTIAFNEAICGVFLKLFSGEDKSVDINGCF